MVWSERKILYLQPVLPEHPWNPKYSSRTIQRFTLLLLLALRPTRLRMPALGKKPAVLIPLRIVVSLVNGTHFQLLSSTDLQQTMWTSELKHTQIPNS